MQRNDEDPRKHHHHSVQRSLRWSTSSESTGPLTVRVQCGLHARTARRLSETARSFQSAAFLHDGRGHRADVRNLLELLLLGVRHGEPVTLRCMGTDADDAFAALAAVLTQEAVTP